MRHTLVTFALLPLLGCEPTDKDGGPIPVEDRPKLDDTAGEGEGEGETAESAEPEPEPDPSRDCHPDLADWSEDWARLEEQVLELVNEERAAGADCGSYGTYRPAGPLEMEEHIRCAARYHSLWMAEEDSFTHESPGGDLGDEFTARMRNAGFTGSPVGENIAAGYSSARDVVAGWMDSDGHCANIMNSSATLTGIGYYQGGSWGTYWTQDFGT